MSTTLVAEDYEDFDVLASEHNTSGFEEVPYGLFAVDTKGERLVFLARGSKDEYQQWVYRTLK